MASIKTSESVLKYFVKIVDGKIISKLSPTFNDYMEYTEVQKEVYDSLVSFPYSCDIENGNVINIVELPKEPLPPSEPSIEERLAEKDRQIEALKEQQARMDADMASFIDFVLTGGM